MINHIKQKVTLLFLISILYSCEAVKEYQKQFLNDKDMEVGSGNLESFETSWESYREGASGGSGSKSGGGCGCN
ncbi:MAG: hypothetical protein COA38_03200 [Fluviicola sp.]|nr:MAG: hypothetical protein COA38_03200 [Fluviicola sp.]